MQYQLRPGRHLFGYLRPRHLRKHIHDTLVCGAGKCDPEAVELVVRRAPELIRDLIAWGTRFDKTPDGRFELNREGGHSEHRILHHEDLTGAEIERALVESVRKHPNITCSSTTSPSTC